jgi:hypothetical protein
VLVCPGRKVLLTGCWWLVFSERKVLVAGKPDEQDAFITDYKFRAFACATTSKSRCQKLKEVEVGDSRNVTEGTYIPGWSKQQKL